MADVFWFYCYFYINHLVIYQQVIPGLRKKCIHLRLSVYGFVVYFILVDTYIYYLMDDF